MSLEIACFSKGSLISKSGFPLSSNLKRMELPNTPTDDDKKQSIAAAVSKDDEKGIPNLPKMPDSQGKFKPVILMQDADADYQVLDLGLMVTLDRNMRKVVRHAANSHHSEFKSFKFREGAVFKVAHFLLLRDLH